MKYLFILSILFILPNYCEAARHSRPMARHPAVDESAIINTDVEQRLLEAINKERRRFGLSDFIIDPVKMTASRIHAGLMSGHGLVHSRHCGAENIAMGYNSVESVVRGWMKSPGHRANILNPKHTKIGVGFYKNYWCQQFGG
jgi:uncharacterized protein YkwD